MALQNKIFDFSNYERIKSQSIHNCKNPFTSECILNSMNKKPKLVGKLNKLATSLMKKKAEKVLTQDHSLLQSTLDIHQWKSL